MTTETPYYVYVLRNSQGQLYIGPTEIIPVFSTIEKEVQEKKLLPGELGVSPSFKKIPQEWGIQGVEFGNGSQDK
jgi:hypothetical protein